jgi:RNA polymerase sigma-70 factor (ECF subfamily)
MDEAAAPAARDDELLAASCADPEQFGVFYERHAAAVFRFCARRTGSREVAEDLTAEVFAAAYVKRSAFRRADVPTRAWLYGIARRQIGTFHRRRRVADRYRRRHGVADAEATDELDQVEALIDLEPLVMKLEDALAELPRTQEQAVRLRIVDQLPYDEIARRLGCSAGAARVRVSRGLTTLCDQLEEFDDRSHPHA